MKTHLFSLILCFCLFLTSSFAQITEPILRLNTPMHSAKIRVLSMDKKGQYVLTASYDKTAKLWDAQTGTLLKTFRPPIGYGNEGLLYACALHPEGEILALGGFTGRSGKTKNIYIFNTSTGEMINRIKGLKNVVFDLMFSPDGQYLAASLGGKEDVKIYKVTKEHYSPMNYRFNLYKELKSHYAYKVAFSQSGMFAFGGYDGIIKLYNKEFNLIKTAKGAGNKIYTIAFSPDEKKIAIGYNDTPEVTIYSIPGLYSLYSPDISGANSVNQRLNKLAFSNDGNYLYGGGFYSKKIDGKWWRIIRIWNQAGRGTYTDYKACDNSILDIKTFPGNSSSRINGVMYAGSRPDFGLLEYNGKQTFYNTSQLYLFTSSDRSHFKVSNNGDIVAFKPFSKNSMIFKVSERSFDELDETTGLESYKGQHYNITITDWKNRYLPKINNKKVSFLNRHEKNRAVDISSDGKRIVLGTSWNIYCTDYLGNKLWKQPVQGTCWTINISGNGKILASGQSGGLIKWYRMSDGKHLLTLYINPETKKWLLYTPDGYYDVSPGAEHYIGWHLNNGPDKEAYFFPASKFRSKYYRPDVIDNILITLDIDEAVRLANTLSNRTEINTKIENMLPPVVNILEPYNNSEVKSDEITVKYSAKSPNGEPIMGVKFMLDGRPIETQRGFKPIENSNTQSKTITIPQKDVTLQVLAENRHGWSSATEVHLKWSGQKINTEDILKPTLYVLAIGVSDYENDAYDLVYASKDAVDFANAIKLQKGGLYKDVVVKVLTNEKATKDGILGGLDWIQKQTTSRDMAMIFIAGHGVNDNIGTFYYLPYEADIESLRRTCLMFTELKYTASAIPGKLVMFVDACHSGDAMGGRRAAPNINSLVNELSDVESGAVVFTSSTGKQFSLENATWQNGAFTKALIEGINGKADLFGKGKISIKALDAYIAERVKELTSGKQSPTVVIPQSMPDFPIGVRR